MRIRISHETRYRFAQPARSLVQMLRLTPRGHEGQRVLKWTIEPSVAGRLKRSEDHFGNIVHMFESEEAAAEIALNVTGQVETSDTHGLVGGTIERLPDAVYLRETDLTRADPAIEAFAHACAAPGGAEPIDVLHRLLLAIPSEIAFDTEPTHAATSAAEAFALRRGVCQDMAHVFIAASRALGIPARYVSGYLFRHDGQVEQEAGHAWAEAKAPDLGWIGFDPANGICVTEAHLRVAIGLDYLGAAPVRGSRFGGGPETLTVALRVADGQHQRQRQRQS